MQIIKPSSGPNIKQIKEQTLLQTIQSAKSRQALKGIFSIRIASARVYTRLYLKYFIADSSNSLCRSGSYLNGRI